MKGKMKRKNLDAYQNGLKNWILLRIKYLSVNLFILSA